jgi:molecular chaperone DnaK
MPRDYIGIDFGTTNTAVVYIQDDELGRRVRPLDDGSKHPFSSTVAIPKQGTELMFGRKVREKRTEYSSTHQIYTSMKAYLGTDYEFKVEQHRYSATDITAKYLEYVKKTIFDEHNIEISSAAFSFPVDFSPEARRELRKAAKRAGIEIVSLVSESTAAYLANRHECEAFSKVMVLDWGGGTLDISILKLHHTEVHEISVSGYKVGGDDIDRELAERIHAKIAAKSTIPNKISFEAMPPEHKDRMLMRCEDAKIEISNSDEDDDWIIRDPAGYGNYGIVRETLTSSQFNAIVEPIIRSKVLSTIEDALAKADLSTASIDAVIVVGGSSNLRMYEYAVTNLFKDAKIIFPERRQWSAAEGAALMQIIGGNFRLNNTLGVLLNDGKVFPIFESGKNSIGDKREPITFSLTEDSLDARFIFTDGCGKNSFATLSVPTKGFYTEKLELYADLGSDQIAQIKITNKSMGDNATEQCEINKLTFYYDTKDLNIVEEWQI